MTEEGYTFREICTTYKVSLGFIQNVIKKHAEEFQFITTTTKTGKPKHRLTKADCKVMEKYIQALYELKENLHQKKQQEKTPALNLEKLKKEHPLVTDERCFDLNYWPDTTPALAVFEE